jgi:hypothetical protein
MSSQRRIDSSRANGARSRGPVTAEGRARSHAAGLTHGLSSPRVVLKTESEEEFRAFREAWIADLQPQTRFEIDLVDRFVADRWRLARVWSLETALLDHEISRQEPGIQDAQTRTAMAFRALCDNSRALDTLGRYEARLSRACDRALKVLESQRALSENQEIHQEPNPESEQCSAPPLPALAPGAKPATDLPEAPYSTPNVASSGRFSDESPTRIANLPGSTVQSCFAASQ